MCNLVILSCKFQQFSEQQSRIHRKIVVWAKCIIRFADRIGKQILLPPIPDKIALIDTN